MELDLKGLDFDELDLPAYWAAVAPHYRQFFSAFLLVL